MNKAKVLETGLDTDTMCRYIVFEFDPPFEGQRTKTVYHTAMTDDGLPTPMRDDMIDGFIRRYVHWIGYELV
jgi:hypothetical protein